MSLDIKASLLSYRAKNGLSESDKGHIKRWLAAAKDVVWQRIVDEIDAAGELAPIQGGAFHFVIRRALRARRDAETAVFESKKIKKRKADMLRQELLEAATTSR
jgi:hypothetical protein